MEGLVTRIPNCDLVCMVRSGQCCFLNCRPRYIYSQHLFDVLLDRLMETVLMYSILSLEARAVV